MVVLLFYNGSESEGRANFKVFFDIGASIVSPVDAVLILTVTGPIMDTTREMPYEELNTLQV